MNILITGGCGFIGSNFIRYLAKEHPSYRLVNLDKLTYAGNLENLNGITSSSGYQFIQGDICNAEMVGTILKQHSIAAVINFAAESHVDRSISGPSIFIETNIGGTSVLLDAAREARIERFIQISTDEVYGSLGPEGRFTETSPLHPNSPYAASKAAADLLALAYHHTYRFPVIITRCSNNYGPYQFPEKLIPLMIANALDDKPLPVYGDGKNIRDWLHVIDHCRAIDVVLHKGINGEVYNIGGNNEWENIAIVKLLLAQLKKPETLISHVKDRPGHDRRYAIDASKIIRELGWKPLTGFNEGMAGTIAWYREHEQWWRRIISGEYRTYYRNMYEA